MTRISLSALQDLIDKAVSSFEAGDLAEARRCCIRAQRETENLDEKIWKLKSHISELLAKERS